MSKENIWQIIRAANDLHINRYKSVSKCSPSTLEIYQFPLYFTVSSRRTTSASRTTHEPYLRHEADKNVWIRPRDETQTSLLTLLSDIGDTVPFPKLRESCAIKRFLWRVYGIEKQREDYRHRQLLASILNTIRIRINYNNLTIKFIYRQFNNTWELVG